MAEEKKEDIRQMTINFLNRFGEPDYARQVEQGGKPSAVLMALAFSRKHSEKINSMLIALSSKALWCEVLNDYNNKQPQVPTGTTGVLPDKR